MSSPYHERVAAIFEASRETALHPDDGIDRYVSRRTLRERIAARIARTRDDVGPATTHTHYLQKPDRFIIHKNLHSRDVTLDF